MIYCTLLIACITLVGALLMLLQTILATAIAQPSLTVCKIYWLPSSASSNSDVTPQPYSTSFEK
ncbi:hypothetical protein [Leptolyngbya sp. FACHB-8]|uniref:hypothetical protein n=1 Tax=Leptolyngbya sp. PL-A3 TaxID=2933911 RepID=UPI001686EF1F|nr:hypothetical protein [Leptolyngbya sp. FACHB-8]